ncbi:hypothetical protein Fot_20821 [Forsythia ovata]|uniref:Uncharacterized protein n=1 Tax=Forsythia ovata TaxID=205694 RepID=A0ABD1UT30_9LAMI
MENTIRSAMMAWRHGKYILLSHHSGDSDLDEIEGNAPGKIVVMAEPVKATLEETVDLQKQKEESLTQQKVKGVAGPSGVVESSSDGESISPRTHMVNLGLAPEEMDRVEGWVEHARELSGEREDPKADLEYWACNQYPSELNLSDFTKLRDHYRMPKGHVVIMCFRLWDEVAPPSLLQGHP